MRIQIAKLIGIHYLSIYLYDKVFICDNRHNKTLLRHFNKENTISMLTSEVTCKKTKLTLTVFNPFKMWESRIISKAMCNPPVAARHRVVTPRQRTGAPALSRYNVH